MVQSNYQMLQTIAVFAARGSDFGQMPQELVRLSKEMMVNAAAVGLAGAAQLDGHIVTRFTQEMGGNGRCTIIGKGLRTSPVYATLSNGVLIRLLDFDDEIPGIGAHPASVIFPVVMALGEMDGLPGQEVLAAFAAGCEVNSRLHSLAYSGESPAEQTDGPLQGFSGIDPAALGAAVAAGKLLHLNEPKMLQALLLTSSSHGIDSPGSYPSPIHAYHQGRAAMVGTMAALLVHQGLNATPDGQGPETGLLPTMGSAMPSSGSGMFDMRLGQPFHVMSRGVSLKLYPCASQAHSIIDAALQLIQQYRFAGEDVAEAEVGLTIEALEGLPFSLPVTGWQARACASFVAASVLAYGHPLIDNFTDAAVADPVVRDLMERVNVEATETPTASFPLPSSVAITLKDGRRLSHRAEFARGLADLPLTTEELDAKFLYCSRYILPPDHIEEAVTRLRDLENIENTTGLFSVLGG